MKYKPSALISSLSGTTGAAVASSWKGRMYIRRHVIPHNPQSDLQMAQRAHMAHQASWFRSLSDQMEKWLEELGTPLALSGYNVTTKANVLAMARGEAPIIVPGNPNVEEVINFSAYGGGGDRHLSATWAQGNAVADNCIRLFTAPVDADEEGKEEPDIWTEHTAAGVVKVSDEACLTAALAHGLKNYYIVLLVGNNTENFAAATKTSGGVAVLATSAPAD